MIEQDGEKPKTYKRSKFFVRTFFKSSMTAAPDMMDKRTALPCLMMVACLYLFLNAMSIAEVSFGSKPRVLTQLNKMETQRLVTADSKGRPQRRMLRAISSIYNKNDDNNKILNIIPNEEWENHAYLPMPMLQPADDPVRVWSKSDAHEAPTGEPNKQAASNESVKKKESVEGKMDSAKAKTALSQAKKDVKES